MFDVYKWKNGGEISYWPERDALEVCDSKGRQALEIDADDFLAVAEEVARLRKAAAEEE